MSSTFDNSVDVGKEKNNPNSDWKLYQTNMQETRASLNSKIHALNIANGELAIKNNYIDFLQKENTNLKLKCNFLEVQAKQDQALIKYIEEVNPKAVEEAMDKILDDSFPINK
jgi:hypothetical protein